MHRLQPAVVACVLAGAGLTIASPSAPAAAASFCAEGAAYSGTTITWTGHGDGHSWAQAKNWSPQVVPDAHSKAATYQTQYVCIGGHAKVVVATGQARHVAGIDVGQGATLTVTGGRLFLGAVTTSTVVPSYVESGSRLEILASVLGGNSPLHVSGVLALTARRVSSGHPSKQPSTMTSSECAYDPDLAPCTSPSPGLASGGGHTIIARHGRLLISGTKFGGVNLEDGRAIENSGVIALSDDGYLAMDDGTSLVDASGSTLDLTGAGGIYRGSAHHPARIATISQTGKITKTGHADDVIGVGVTFHGKPTVTIKAGSLTVAGNNAPRALVSRAAGYGIGGCGYVVDVPCKGALATAAFPEVVLAYNSAEAKSPSTHHLALALGAPGGSVKGHRVLGRPITLTDPEKPTTSATHLTFKFDATTAHLPSPGQVDVYRGSTKLTRCNVSGITAHNTSCVLSVAIDPTHKPADKGDLTVIVISIRPSSRWRVV
jgi:hypothetical protein